jgi:hypothetical protein
MGECSFLFIGISSNDKKMIPKSFEINKTIHRELSKDKDDIRLPMLDTNSPFSYTRFKKCLEGFRVQGLIKNEP